MAAKTNVSSPKRTRVQIIDAAAASLVEKAKYEDDHCKYMPMKDKKVCEISNLLTTVAGSILRIRAEIAAEDAEVAAIQDELANRQRIIARSRVIADQKRNARIRAGIPGQRQYQPGTARQPLSA